MIQSNPCRVQEHTSVSIEPRLQAPHRQAHMHEHKRPHAKAKA